MPAGTFLAGCYERRDEPRGRRVTHRVHMPWGFVEAPGVAFGPLVIHRHPTPPGDPQTGWSVSHESGEWLFVRDRPLVTAYHVAQTLLRSGIDWSHVSGAHLDRETAARIVALTTNADGDFLIGNLKVGLPAKWLHNGGGDFVIPEKRPSRRARDPEQT